MTDKARDVESIFHEARQIPDPVEREAYLARLGADDRALRERVELLLKAEAESRSFLASAETVAMPSGSRGNTPFGATASVSERPGDVIGRYKLLQQIGEGGFGAVYMAEQREPVQRKVALKIIKLGMDTRQVIARFEQERQALAMMEHPHIAKVLDAGTTATGRPYFVMELVKGIPITDYCDRENMSFRDRLKLFIQVCSAVQHAHQKGVIHRDIKPSNVLVTHVDEKPVPKVIDFGIAKATQQKLTEHTMFTELGQFMGTPTYMSPEQADPLGLDIDTRSDIYSLGVLLYELLTGATPFEVKTLRAAALDEIKRIIREDDPPRPSTRFSTLGLALSTVAKQRGVEPKKLGTILRGDLDWIIMRAMEKDRTRRYESAIELARDIERHLNQEPVTAGPPTAAYRMRKFVRRHRTGVGLATVGVLMLVLFAGTMAFQARRIAAERDRANQARAVSDRVVEFQVDMLSGIKPLKLGETIAADLRERISGALSSKGTPDDQRETTLTAFDTLLGEVSLTDTARNIVDINILAPASKAVETQFLDQPLVEARLLEALGETYRALGLSDRALPYSQRASDLYREQLGALHRDTLLSRLLVAMILWDLDRNTECGEILRDSIAILERTFGPEDRNTLKAKMLLGVLDMDLGRGDLARKRYEELIAIQERVLGPDHRDVAVTLSNLGTSLLNLHQEADAVTVLERCMNIRLQHYGPDHPETITTMQTLAKAYQGVGKIEESARMLLEAIKRSERVRGARHPDTIQAITSLTLFYKNQGRFQEAEPLARKVLELSRATWGDFHRRTINANTDLGIILAMLGRHHEAEPFHVAAYEISRDSQGPDHSDTADRLNNLAVHYWYLGQYQKALELFAENLESLERRFGKDEVRTTHAMVNLAVVYTKLRRLDEAQSILDRALSIRTKAYGPDHPLTLETRSSFAHLTFEKGDWEKAEQLFVELITTQRKVLGADHPYTLQSQYNLGFLYYKWSRYADAEPLLSDALARRRAVVGATHSETLDTATELASLYMDTGRLEEARPLFEEVISARRSAAASEGASPAQLNACASILLVCPIEELRNPDEALHLAQKANEATNQENPVMLDTLARALFDVGRHAEAIETQRNAIERLPEGSQERDDYGVRLAEYSGNKNP